MRLVSLSLALLFLVAVPIRAEDGPRVVETESGLKIEFLEEGKEGTEPAKGDRVTVHYTGTLLDGTKFDSSVDRNEPFSFPLGAGRVIRGWDEALPHLTVGSKARLTIPADLAYGPAARPGIPANSTLVFVVELLEVTKELPFVKPVEEELTAFPSGVKYRVIEEGEGEPAGPGTGVTMRFALYSESGELISSTVQSGEKLGGPVSKLPLRFLNDAVGVVRPGGSYLFVVPPAYAFGGRGLGKLPPNSTTVWRIELESVNDVPAFRLPDEEKAKTTESGLRYEVIEEGEGTSPGRTARVKVHYTGWLTDGTLFDSSHARGDPIVFPLNRVIPGWTEGVGLMKPGAKYLFSIPGKLAYGPNPPPGSGIPPNATLVFLVELISVE